MIAPVLPANQCFKIHNYATPRGLQRPQAWLKFENFEEKRYITEMDGFHLFELKSKGGLMLAFCKIVIKKKK